MKTELKHAWLDALRSGAYKQGKGLLRDYRNTYCCLGVLCEVAGMQWIEGATGDYAPDNQSIYMPTPSQMEALGLWRDDAMRLAEMNDRGDSFRDIAHVLETLITEE